MSKKTTPNSAGPADSNKRVTLRTLAEVTGLSLSTVSLSLRGGASLKQETRDKVQAAAEALGYVPDRAGVRLRTGKTNVIALVLDGAENSIDFARQMIQGIGAAIKGTRYHLTVIPEFEREVSTDTVRYILDNRAADGVILTHTAPLDPRVEMLIEAGLPFVSHGRTEFATPHPFHDFHSEIFASSAVQRLASQGARSLMLVIGNDRTTNYRNIVTSFESAAAATGVGTSILDGSARSHAELRQFGLDLAASGQFPEGIICDNEMRTIALASGLQEGGLALGKDVRIIYKQTSGILPTLFPAMDSIGEDIFAAGSALTNLLLKRIDGVSPSQLQTLSAPMLHWRS
ncbi:MAG TPA: LacI family transcriptional regulator [Devosia sp.]|nr:LacI family transcriptional regulator [Devosia sp.]